MNPWIRPVVVALAALLAAAIAVTVDGGISLHEAFVIAGAGVGTFATEAGFTLNSVRSTSQLRGIAERLPLHVAPTTVKQEAVAAVDGSRVVHSRRIRRN